MGRANSEGDGGTDQLEACRQQGVGHHMLQKVMASPAQCATVTRHSLEKICQQNKNEIDERFNDYR